MDEVKLQLRLDPELHERLVAAARENARSLNAELKHRLQTSLEPNVRWAPGGTPQDLAKRAAFEQETKGLLAQVAQRQEQLLLLTDSLWKRARAEDKARAEGGAGGIEMLPESENFHLGQVRHPAKKR